MTFLRKLETMEGTLRNIVRYENAIESAKPLFSPILFENAFKQGSPLFGSHIEATQAEGTAFTAFPAQPHTRAARERWKREFAVEVLGPSSLKMQVLG